jgi:thiamine biosynthesis lipoprotein
MKQSDLISTKLDLGEVDPTCGVQRFAHAAMATLFEVHCVHSDPEYARQAAQAAFDLVDQLELELSRFIANSDISRINGLESGQSVQVNPWTIECLQIARRIFDESDGAFDISIGSGFDTLDFDTDDFTVRARADGVNLDLGGIGKGYAVDRMAELLEEWKISQSLLHGGFSSVLALEPPPDRHGWPLTLSMPGRGVREVLARVSARRLAFSASGIQKRDHIVNARSRQPVRNRLASWVSVSCGGIPAKEAGISGGCETRNSAAAVADALSTTFMILPMQEINNYCAKWQGLEAWLIGEDFESGRKELTFEHFP